MSGYQSIAKVAEASGLSAPTLRYYEQEGIIPPVPRDGAGNRLYGEEEISRINTIRCLRAAGLTLPQMKRYFAMSGTDDDVLRVRREILLNTQEHLAAQLDEIRRCMSYLKEKIHLYDLMIAALEKGEKLPVFHPEELNKLFAPRQLS